MNPRRLAPAAACVLFFSLQSFAQTTPLPTPPAPQFPITGYVDRYLDSASIRDFQGPTRTFRAQTVKVAPELDRIFMIFGGGTFASYNISTFQQRLNQPLATGTHGERYAPFDMSVDPQRPGSGWFTPLLDGQERLFDFDWDDRGFIYLAYSVWGWGIVDLQGTLQVQIPEPGPVRITSVKASGRYYALVQDFNTPQTLVYDTTDQRAPVLVRTLPFTFIDSAKSAAEIAVIAQSSDGLREVRIYTPDALVNGGAFTAIPRVSGGSPLSITSDGSSFFTASSTTTGNAVMTEIRQNGAMREQIEIFSRMFVSVGAIRYGAGYVALIGRGGGGAGHITMDIVRTTGATREAYNLTQYFQTAYSSTTPRFLPITAAPVATPEGVRLITALFGLGDVWALHSPGVFQFSTTSAEVSERDGSVTLTVTRSGGSDGAVTVPFTVTAGTASLGADYTGESGAITFAAGETTRTVVVTIVNDSIVEPSETLTVTLGSPTDGSVGPQSSVVVTIVDDEADIRVTAAAPPAAVIAGEPVSQTFTITNDGPAAASNIVVTVDVTPGVAATITSSAGVCTASSCVVASLLSGQAVTVTVMLTAPDGGNTLGLTATVTSDADPVISNNVVTLSIPVIFGAEIPTLSDLVLLFLAGAVALIACVRLRG